MDDLEDKMEKEAKKDMDKIKMPKTLNMLDVYVDDKWSNEMGKRVEAAMYSGPMFEPKNPRMRPEDM